jgi:hypothetical protein
MEKILFEFSEFMFIATQAIITVFLILIFVIGGILNIQDFIEKIKRR